MSATASRRPPWQNPRRRRQAALGAGILLLGYLVLFVVALLGGPRIGVPFLPLPGGGPEPASPVAAPQPGQPTENIAIPHQATSTPSATPAVTPGAVPTPLPTATKPGEVRLPPGVISTPNSTLPPGTPTPQIVETTGPAISPATQRPPTAPPTLPTAPPTTDPTSTPTASPTTPPTTPDNPDRRTGLTYLLGHLFDKLGL